MSSINIVKRKNMNNICKFYTNGEIAIKIVGITLKMFPNINNFVEPSAGCRTIGDAIVEREQ